MAVEATLGGRGIREGSATDGGRLIEPTLLALAALDGRGIPLGIPEGGGIALDTPAVLVDGAMEGRRLIDGWEDGREEFEVLQSGVEAPGAAGRAF